MWRFFWDFLTNVITAQGFIQEFVLGGRGNFVSGEQWACETRLPGGGGGSGGPPPNIFCESKCPEINSGGIWQLKSGTGDCGYRYRLLWLMHGWCDRILSFYCCFTPCVGNYNWGGGGGGGSQSALTV